MIFRGSSRASYAQAREQLAAAVSRPGVAAAVSGELFAVTGLLDTEAAVRRSLTDSSSAQAARTGLIRDLLGGRVSDTTFSVLTDMVAARWSAPRDLPDATEQLAVLAAAAAADAEGQLDTLEDELFRFGRIASAEPELYAALSSPRLPDDRKRGLLESLLSDKVTPVSLRLIVQAALHPRGRSLEANLAEYARLAAAWRQRLIAIVRVATPLTGSQRERLVAALSATYGRGIQLNVVLDPQVLGGMSIQVGDEFIDGTLSSRLAALRQWLAA